MGLTSDDKVSHSPRDNNIGPHIARGMFIVRVVGNSNQRSVEAGATQNPYIYGTLRATETPAFQRKGAPSP